MEKKELIDALKHVVALIVIVGIIVAFFFILFFPELKKLFWKSGLDEDTKNQVLENFDNFVGNLKQCEQIKDELCICDGWPSFPSVFHKDAILIINDGTGDVYLYDGKNPLKNEVIENMGIFIQPAAIHPDKGLFFAAPESMGIYTTTFSKEVPIISKTARGYIISEYFFKDEVGDINFITSFFGSADIKVVDSLKKEIEKIPKCTENRKKAIEEFEKIINTEASIYQINLPQDYVIDINNEEISLKYNDVQVKKIGFKTYSFYPGELNSKIITNIGKFIGIAGKESVNLVNVEELKTQMVLCQGSKSSGSLKSGDFIEFRQAQGNCLFVS
jgi:hypothetical protein